MKPDDSSLDPEQLRAVEERARSLLDRAAGWNRYPTPVPDILEAARLRVATTSVFDPVRIMEYLRTKATSAAARLKSAISKCLGILDADENTIHIDDSVGESKQNFLKLHETGHHEIPWQQRVFGIFQDCEKTLSPAVADLFEREANNFARCLLFQGDGYERMAADHALEIRTPMKLAKKFGASVYASCREFARTNWRACVVYVLEPIEFCEGTGARARVRRVEASPSFVLRFGTPEDEMITLDHPLGVVLPVGRRMTRPRTVVFTDRNGDAHECLAEAFSTPFNVIILAYPINSLTATTLVMPAIAQIRKA